MSLMINILVKVSFILLEYIENWAKNKNIVFNIILESHYSYRKFIEFLGSINVCKVFNKIYTLNHTMNLNYIWKIWGFLQKNGIPLEIISSNSKVILILWNSIWNYQILQDSYNALRYILIQITRRICSISSHRSWTWWHGQY